MAEEGKLRKITTTNVGATPGVIPKEQREALVYRFQLFDRLPETAELILPRQPEHVECPEDIKRGLKEVELYMASAIEHVEGVYAVSTDGIYGRPADKYYKRVLSERCILGCSVQAVDDSTDGHKLARELIALIRTQLRLREELCV